MIRTLIASVFIAAQLLSAQAMACSSFGGSTPAFRLMGKSYDFQLSHGIALINKRNMKKVALVGPRDTAAEWTSKYGSLTYTQFGRDFPISGLNEKGLAIEILWDFDTDGPDNKGPLPAVNEAQWIQYQLDISGSVREVIANSKTVRMKKIYAPIHYLVCDSTGECATFEFDQDNVTIQDVTNNPTLTNSEYKSALTNLRRFEGFGGREKIPFGSYNSLDRFVILNAQLGTLRAKPTLSDGVTFGFDMLKSVRGRGLTQWNMVHDLKNGVSHFRRVFNERVTRVTRLSQFDFSCKSAAQMVDLETEDEFGDYNPALNRETVQIAGRALGMEAALIEAVAKYPDSTVCTE